MKTRRCCYACYWYWNLTGAACHAAVPRRFDETGYCIAFKKKFEKKEPDAQKLYEEYQREWN